MREALRQGISRGKLECTLRFTEETTGKPLQVDRDRAAQLVAAAETIAGLIKQPARIEPSGSIRLARRAGGRRGRPAGKGSRLQLIRLACTALGQQL